MTPSARGLRTPGGTIRASAVRGIPTALEQHGVTATPLFRDCGVGPASRLITNRRIPFRALGSLLEASGRLTRSPHFGLLAAQDFELSDTGLPGALVLSSPTVGQALLELNRRWHLHDNAALGLVRRVDRRRVALTYTILDGGTPGANEITDGALAMMFRAMRELAGPGWHPDRVLMARRRPRNVLPYRRVFGTDIRFEADVSALVFDDSWLDCPAVSADPLRYQSLSATIADEGSELGPDWSTRVRQVTCAQLLAGDTSSQGVADLFGISRRTLHRRLDSCGTSFRALSEDVRFNLALHLLRNTALPIRAIAETLGYSDASSFARAFHRWNGTSARALRASMRTMHAAETAV